VQQQLKKWSTNYRYKTGYMQAVSWYILVIKDIQLFRSQYL